MKEFINHEKTGILNIDKVFMESNYPVLFTCKNEKADLFLCSCCQADRNEKKWLVTKTTAVTIVEMLKNEITIRDAFLRFDNVQLSILANSRGTNIEENNVDDWSNESSLFLPDVGEYMDAEENEYRQEIEYYKNMKRKKKKLEGTSVVFDPPEKLRIYRFPNNELVRLENVVKLTVRNSGTHRLETLDGKSHIVPTGWIHIELDIKDWTL